jgi:hypothetical protein
LAAAIAASLEQMQIEEEVKFIDQNSKRNNQEEEKKVPEVKN